MDWRTWWALGVYFGTLVIPYVMLFVVPRERRPSSAIAWLLVIAILPWIGFLLFLVLGHPRLPRQRRRRLEHMRDQMRLQVETTLADPDAPWLSRHAQEQLKDQAGVAAMATRLGAMVPLPGNSIELLDDYATIMARTVADVRQARHFVHVQSYIFTLDAETSALVEALLEARRRGVRVRVLLDHLGSRGFAGHRRLLRTLGKGDIEWRHMLPFQPWRLRFARPDLRNHRKIVVIDGDVAYAGSLNLVDRHYRKHADARPQYTYLEVVARVRGPLVQELDAVFRGDWYAETGHLPLEQPVAQVHAGDSLAHVLPSGPGHAPSSNLRVFNALLYQAQRRIVIVNAYFVPDETLMMALTTAAERGVDVCIVTPAKGNQFLLRLAQRSFYAELLRAGVKIYLHPRPWNLHSKTLSIDDDACVVGSSNLDTRSFDLNLEVSLICYDPEVVAALHRIEDGYVAQSTRLTKEAWAATPRVHRAVQDVARLTSALQ